MSQHWASGKTQHWPGWRERQPAPYPIEIVAPKRRPTPEPRPSMSRWSDTPRRVIPPPDEPHRNALVLHWFTAEELEALEGKPKSSAKGGGRSGVDPQ